VPRQPLSEPPVTTASPGSLGAWARGFLAGLLAAAAFAVGVDGLTGDVGADRAAGDGAQAARDLPVTGGRTLVQDRAAVVRGR
jgi:hypothetical protein